MPCARHRLANHGGGLAQLAQAANVLIGLGRRQGHEKAAGGLRVKEHVGQVERHVGRHVHARAKEVAVAAGEPEAATCEVPAAKKNVTVQISAETMGTGDDLLGKKLMKAFIFSLTQLEELPQTILFYNGGAHLTCEGSDSLEDLKNLADAGVEILTCGTCTDFYGITDKLAVGEVTNMYVIAERLSGASVVVRP